MSMVSRGEPLLHLWFFNQQNNAAKRIRRQSIHVYRLCSASSLFKSAIRSKVVISEMFATSLPTGTLCDGKLFQVRMSDMPGPENRGLPTHRHTLWR